MTKQFEIEVEQGDTLDFQITGVGATVYAYATDAFALSIYGYNVLTEAKELIVSVGSNAHDEVRVRLNRAEDGTIMYVLELHGEETDEEVIVDLPMIGDLAGGRYSKIGLLPNEDATIQVWE